MRLLSLLVLAVALISPGAVASAATADGFITAGGGGVVKCAIFTNAVAEARQMGLGTTDGINHINPFIQYAFGFFTGYNSVADDVYDILADLRGDGMHIAILTMMDTYCQRHPTKSVDDALFDITTRLSSK